MSPAPRPAAAHGATARQTLRRPPGVHGVQHARERSTGGDRARAGRMRDRHAGRLDRRGQPRAAASPQPPARVGEASSEGRPTSDARRLRGGQQQRRRALPGAHGLPRLQEVPRPGGAWRQEGCRCPMPVPIQICILCVWLYVGLCTRMHKAVARAGPPSQRPCSSQLLASRLSSVKHTWYSMI